ncbi:MAG: hypothetical protein K6F14_04445 [Clostridiales bacterium]|nr:hypothetical protein [Clostridiales bacterium]
MLLASEYGFSPENDGIENREKLQKILDIGGHILVDKPGVYDVCGMVLIGSNTTLEFTKGSAIRRISCEDGNDSLIQNKGALTKEYDTNISILGMTLICNGVDTEKQRVIGINAQIGLFYVKNTVIRDFACMDLPCFGFCIQICTFEDSIIENVHIEGMKDAVHYGPGKKFVLRNGLFRTFDDPVALNANDYATSNPQMGWIEDGVIENCTDLDQPETTGFFCRILAGSWLDWEEGMMIRNSDTVVSNGRMYRAVMPADGKEYTSFTRPTHESGVEVLDGIKWAMTQDDNVINNCGCRNIHFKNIHLNKHRPVAFCFHFDNDNNSHSYYPYSDAPVQTDITFEGIHYEAEIPYFLRSTTPVGSTKIINSELNNCKIRFAHRGVDGIKYNTSNVTISGCTFTGECSIAAVEGRDIVLHCDNNKFPDNSKLELIGNIKEIKRKSCEKS